MQIGELNDIMQAISKLDIPGMEVQDQLLFLSAELRFAETLKPLVIKYVDKLPENIKFLIKI